MTDQNNQRKRRLVGNDIIVPSKRPARRVAQPAKPEPSTARPLKPTPKASIAEPRKTVAAPKTIPKTEQSSSHQAFINALAFDLLLIVMLGYAVSVSSWAFSILIAYAVLALFFHISSLRLFISAGICIVLVPILDLVHRTPLLKAYALFAIFYLVVATVRAVLERHAVKQTVHNS
jgi:hypothetical protein